MPDKGEQYYVDWEQSGDLHLQLRPEEICNGTTLAVLLCEKSGKILFTCLQAWLLVEISTFPIIRLIVVKK